MASYSAAFNTNSLNGVDEIDVSDLTVTGSLDMTGALVSGIPVDGTSVAFDNHILSVKLDSIGTNYIQDRAVTEIKIALGAVKTPELGNLTSITFQQGVGNTTTVNNVTPTVNTTVSIPDPGVSASSFIIKDGGTQTINSDLTLAGVVDHQDTTRLSALSPSSVIYLNGSKDIVPATLNNGQLLIGATGTNPAVGNITSSSLTITNGANTINIETAGSPTLGKITLTDTSNQIIINPGGPPNKSIILNATNPPADRVYTFPDVLTNSEFVMTNGDQKIEDFKSFKSGVYFGDPFYGTFNTNQLFIKYMALGGKYTVIADDTFTNQLITIPDSVFNGGSSSSRFILSEGNRTFNNLSTFNDSIILNGTSGSTNGLMRIGNSGSATSYKITCTNPSASRTINIPDPNATTYFILGDGPSQTVNVITNQSFTLKGDSTSSAPSQLLVTGATDPNKQTSLGIDTTNNLGTFSYYNATSSATSSMCIVKAGGLAQVGSGFTTPANNTAGKVFIFGSNTTDVADVLKIRENTNTNPKEIFLGYNTSGNYGVIQSVQHGTAYKDTRISPNGGSVYVGNTGTSGGIIFPNTNMSGATYQTLLADYGLTTQSNTFSCGSGAGGTTATVTVTFERTGSFVKCYIPVFSLTSGSLASDNITSSVSIPSGFRPGTDCVAGYARSNNNGTFNSGFLYIASNVLKIYRDGPGSVYGTSITVGLANNSGCFQWNT